MRRLLSLILLLICTLQTLHAQQQQLYNYAITVTQAGKEKQRKLAIVSFCNKLKQSTSPTEKLFLINCLRLCGDDNAIATLRPYLLQPTYCRAAAVAMTQIGGAVAKPALTVALAKATGACLEPIVQALGELRYLSAVDAITALANTNDFRLRGAVLRALANIGDSGSDSVLRAAAVKTSFLYDSTNATASYLWYASRLSQNWPQAPAEAIASFLIRRCTTPAQLPVKIAAFRILISVRDHDANRLLADALHNESPAFRAAVLQLAEERMNNASAGFWMDQLQLEQGANKAAIIYLLSRSQGSNLSRILPKALLDTDPVVRNAAIRASASSYLVPYLLRIMKTADSATVTLVRDVLCTIRGGDVVVEAAMQLASQPPLAQIALLQVLAARRADETRNSVTLLLNSDDPAVRAAADSTIHTFDNSHP